MAKVALDADVVISFLDASDDQHQRAVDVLRPRLATGDRMILAASVYAEILVHPIKRDADKAIDEFITAIGPRSSRSTATSLDEPQNFALRTANLRLPDALSLAPLSPPAPTC